MPNPGSSEFSRPTASPRSSTTPVTVNYVNGICKADPDRAFVLKGDKLRFHKGAGPEGAKVRISLPGGPSFSASAYNEGDPDVEVIADLTGRVDYLCELVLDGTVIASSKGTSGSGPSGGAIEPATGDNARLRR